MKIVVLGATGGVGLEIVRQAVSRGHSVTAFVRSRERLKPFGKSINAIEGDLLNAAELAQVIKGHDAVLSGFGPRVPVAKAEEHHLQRFAEALTSAMSQTEVQRVIVVSTAFLFRDSLIPPTYLVGRLFFPVTVADAIVPSSALPALSRPASASAPWKPRQSRSACTSSRKLFGLANLSI